MPLSLAGMIRMFPSSSDISSCGNVKTPIRTVTPNNFGTGHFERLFCIVRNWDLGKCSMLKRCLLFRESFIGNFTIHF